MEGRDPDLPRSVRLIVDHSDLTRSKMRRLATEILPILLSDDLPEDRVLSVDPVPMVRDGDADRLLGGATAVVPPDSTNADDWA